MARDWQVAGFGLYLHWPFCQAKCPYCDFNSHVAAEIDQNRWADAYCAEIKRVGAETQGRVLGSVFFGGGTPSMMTPDLVARVLEEIRATWPTVNDMEITLEANPTSVEAGRFRGYRDAGVTRVSLGIQALKDADLQAIGRLHNAAEARAAFDLARSVFDRVSFDLIYARQHQTLEDWRAELSEAVAMAADHLSLYQLTIENGTAFGDRFHRGRLGGLPSDDLGADLYETTQEICNAAGLPAYEVSNHAAIGSESRHNLIYWRAGDYAGIGPGAHGRLTLDGHRLATESPRAPGTWLSQVETTGHGELERAPLSSEDRFAEHLMMGLRLSEGVDLDRIARDTGQRLSETTLAELCENGLIRRNGDHLSLTPAGFPLLNAVLRALLA